MDTALDRSFEETLDDGDLLILSVRRPAAFVTALIG
jgi:hypothetical protein